MRATACARQCANLKRQAAGAGQQVFEQSTQQHAVHALATTGTHNASPQGHKYPQEHRHNAFPCSHVLVLLLCELRNKVALLSCPCSPHLLPGQPPCCPWQRNTPGAARQAAGCCSAAPPEGQTSSAGGARACDADKKGVAGGLQAAVTLAAGGARQRAAQKGKGAMTTAREEGGRHVRGSSGVDMGKRTGAQARMD